MRSDWTHGVPATVVGALAATTHAHAASSALRRAPGDNGWTWSEQRERVRAGAAGLAEPGSDRGDVLAFWLTNRRAFHVMDLAAVDLVATFTRNAYPAVATALARPALAT